MAVDTERKLDAMIAQEVYGYVWQSVPWLNAEQSVLVPYQGYLENDDPRIRLGDDIVYKFVKRNETTDRLLALLILELRELRDAISSGNGCSHD